MLDTDSIILVYGGNTSLPTITKTEILIVDQTINVCVAPFMNKTIPISKENITFLKEMGTFSFARPIQPWEFIGSCAKDNVA
jgi:hypothetical protein